MGTFATASRPDLEAYERSIHLGTAQLVVELREILGAKLVAYLGSVQETRAVRQWADGTRVPSADVVTRLRLAYRMAWLLKQKDSSAVAQAWFQGMNPRLGDVAPARMLRESAVDEVGAEILAAAHAFAAAG